MNAFTAPSTPSTSIPGGSLPEALSHVSSRASSKKLPSDNRSGNIAEQLQPREALEFPTTRPTEQEIRDTDEGMRKLAGFMLRHNADNVRSEPVGAETHVFFHFDH